MLTIDDKAEIIMECMRQAFEQENGLKTKAFPKDLQKEIAFRGVIKGLEEIEEQQPTRTLDEVQNIVDCVRADLPVQIEYWDPDEDEDEYVAKACW